MSQLEIIDLNKIYPIGDDQISAVNNVNISIDKGNFLSVVGHSGSGKTTLISMIGGILRPTSGKILLDGIDICTLTDDQLSEFRNTKIGFMFQFASLLPMLSTKENVLLPNLFDPHEKTPDNNKAEEYLELVGIKEKKNVYPAQLSGGQQRRVAIARALMNDPVIILADEPTGDLDEETEAEVIELFKKINKEKSVTIVLITHNLELAKQADTQFRMTQGVLKTL